VKTIVKYINLKSIVSYIITHLNLIGDILITISLIGIFFTFGPALSLEGNYQIKKALNIKNYVNETAGKDEVQKASELVPPNFDFSIVIPKIGAVAPVFSNIDPFNEKEYLKVLHKGVAHAKGTALPGQMGNTFIFAHSTDAFYNVGRYNAVFYLIGKLTAGDEVYIYYNNQKFVYTVFDKKVVPANAYQYLGILKKNTSTLTLQTCYPPGTTLKRLVVMAELNY
jgi:LPXTG-site transpeptidase (sortase) family protein